jgi:hypothetical protein
VTKNVIKKAASMVKNPNVTTQEAMAKKIECI